MEQSVREQPIYHKNQKPVVYVVGDVGGPRAQAESPVYGVLDIGEKLSAYRGGCRFRLGAAFRLPRLDRLDFYPHLVSHRISEPVPCPVRVGLGLRHHATRSSAHHRGAPGKYPDGLLSMIPGAPRSGEELAGPIAGGRELRASCRGRSKRDDGPPRMIR